MAKRLLKLFKNVIIYGITIVYALIKIFIIILVLILIYNIFFAVHKSPDEFVLKMDDYYQKNERDLKYIANLFVENPNITEITRFNDVCTGDNSTYLYNTYKVCYNGTFKINKSVKEKITNILDNLDLSHISIYNCSGVSKGYSIIFNLGKEAGVNRLFEYCTCDEVKPINGVTKYGKAKTIVKQLEDNWYYSLSDTPL